MKTHIAFLAVLSFTLTAAAQPPDTLWTRTYGWSTAEFGYCVQQTSDGGYIIVGETNGYYNLGYQVYLVKTDALGNQVWQRGYGGYNNDDGRCVQQTSDGGYVITGRTFRSGLAYQVSLIKTNSSGDTVWTHAYGGIGEDYGYSLDVTTDGGYVITGWTNSYGAGAWDVYLIKTDASGILTWQQTFGGTDWDRGYGVQQTSDGGYIITGDTWSYSAGNSDVLVIKTDTSGNEVWQRTFGGFNDDYGRSVQQTPDEGYVIAGTASNPTFQAYLIKMDSLGNQVWQRTFGGSSDQVEGYSVQQTFDGGYVITGYWRILNLNFDVYLLKTDTAGDLVWQRSFGGSNSDWGYSVVQTSDSGYAIAGVTYSYGAGGTDVYLIKTTAGGSTPLTLNITLTPINPPITIPANGGSFQFNASTANYGTQIPYYVWARDRYPGGTYTGNLLGPVNINPPVGVTVTRQRTQVVPSSWPAGLHYYIGYANTTVSYPATDADSFSWTKSTAGDGGATVWEVVNYGEPFPGEELSTGEIYPSSFILYPSHPNPFNASTSISYELPTANQVSLKVFDTSGRLVATLADGFRQTGEQNVTFDGSELAAGVYLVRLEAGRFTATQKMVLLK